MCTDENSIAFFNCGDFSSMNFCSLPPIYVNFYHSQGLDNTTTAVFPQLHKISQDYAKWDRLSQILGEAADSVDQMDTRDSW